MQTERRPRQHAHVQFKFPTLAERVAFLQQYVTFRRTYETLDFDIMYQNNGGGSLP